MTKFTGKVESLLENELEIAKQHELSGLFVSFNHPIKNGFLVLAGAHIPSSLTKDLKVGMCVSGELTLFPNYQAHIVEKINVEKD